MRKPFVIAAVAVGLVATGCNEDKCPTESPQVSALAQSCTQRAGEPVTYPVRLCPTCNQTGATCDVDMSAVGNGSGAIFLDPKVEACDVANSCPPACELNAINCTFTAPAPGEYTILAFDPTTNATKESTLVVVASGAEFCNL